MMHAAARDRASPAWLRKAQGDGATGQTRQGYLATKGVAGPFPFSLGQGQDELSMRERVSEFAGGLGDISRSAPGQRLLVQAGSSSGQIVLVIENFGPSF